MGGNGVLARIRR